MDGDGANRRLATIVITDVVGFSKIAGLDEPRALALLQRDLAILRSICDSHGGTVANNTGDGLVLLFSSAVEAMRCALEFQQGIADRISRLKPVEVLHHRIGVHLGDVVVEGENVFGDGVNVAARLEAEARPDSIWLSRTVYDVIKNKVPVQATYVGPRTLKNIPERVMVWMIPGPEQGPKAPDPGFEYIRPPDESGVGGTKAVAMIGVGVVALVALVAVISVQWKNIVGTMNSTPPATGHLTIKAPPIKKPQTAGSTQGVQTPTSADEEKLLNLKLSYQFADYVEALKEQGYDQKPGGPEEIQKYSGLADMRKWLEQSLGTVTAQSPLKVELENKSGQVVSCSVYGNPAGGIFIDTGTASTLPPEQIWDLSPQSILNLASAASQLPQPPPDVQSWLKTFQQEYVDTKIETGLQP